MIKKLERNIWIFPLIGSIFILIALLSPAAWYDSKYDGTSPGYFYMWIWGLFSGWAPGYYPTISFSPDPFVLFPSIAITFFVLLSFILLFKSSYAVWKGNKSNLDVKKTWKVMLIILIISIGAWIVWMEVEMRMASNLEFSFWSFSFPGFGIIGIIIGIIFVICGLVLIDYVEKHKREIESMEMKKEPEADNAQPTTTKAAQKDVLWLGFKMNKNIALVLAIISVISIILCILGLYTGVYNILYEVFFSSTILYPHVTFFYVVSFVLMSVALIFCLHTLNKCKEFQ